MTEFKLIVVKQEVVSEDERRRTKVQQTKLHVEQWKDTAEQRRCSARNKARSKLSRNKS